MPAKPDPVRLQVRLAGRNKTAVQCTITFPIDLLKAWGLIRAGEPAEDVVARLKNRFLVILEETGAFKFRGRLVEVGKEDR
ncbi:MAG: hypothetical protein DRO11_00155 [Methanobacteriota archaeon]|nr:MAG: hypothetical protein DRO11_00155 [Euryarchaeota archaeon]